MGGIPEPPARLSNIINVVPAVATPGRDCYTRKADRLNDSHSTAPSMPIAEIHVTLKPSLFDAPGATVLKALHQLGHTGVREARIGKYITLDLDGIDPRQLQGQLELMCQQLLANPVIENYEVTLAEGPSNGAAAAMITGRAAGGPAVAASVLAEATPPVTAGGITITDPFAVDYLTYGGMTTEAKLALRALALQKYGNWIRQSLRDRHAAWILCVGQDVVSSDDSLDTYPTESQLDQLGYQRDLVPWVFTRPPGSA